MTICSAPSAGTRIVKNINIFNADTVAATVTVNLQTASAERVLYKATLAADEALIRNDAIVLTTADSLEVILGGAVTTNELPFYVAYGDFTT